MINVRFESIDLTHIRSSIASRVSESKTLEFKQLLNVLKDEDKKEFLYDVTSFANAQGGDILYGVKESGENSVINEIVGLSGNSDQLTTRVEEMLRDSVLPKIVGLRYKVIPLHDQLFLLLIRVPNSLTSPHMVTFQRVNRFYSRNANSKSMMDVFELRTAFSQSSQLTDKVRSFIDSRVALIEKDKGSVNVHPVASAYIPKVILPLVPLKSVMRNFASLPVNTMTWRDVVPLGCHNSGGGRFNLEGLCSHKKNGSAYSAYTQLFRSGIIESVNTSLLHVYGGNKLI